MLTDTTNKIKLNDDFHDPEYLDLWTMPSNYCGEVWPATYSAGLGQSRDSDALERANFDAMVDALDALPPMDDDGDAGWQVVRESHWAVGWVEWIAIDQDATDHLRVADAIMRDFEDYPVIDEDRYTEYELEEANLVWSDCYNVSERVDYIRDNRGQFDFRDYADLLSCVRGEYFSGYASELLC